MKYASVLLLFLASATMFAQPRIAPRLLNGFWTARWIADPGSSGTEFGVYHFRKTMEYTKNGQPFVVHVTADNRYRLYVNGIAVSSGPARSDLANWNYETVDIAPYLKNGKNIIAATVWNFAEYRPYSQISFETAFLLQGNTAVEEIINTNTTWKVYKDPSYSILPVNKGALQAYFVVAEGEQIDGNRYPWGAGNEQYDDATWKNAKQLWYAPKARGFGTDGNWQLVPRSIPMEEEYLQDFQTFYKAGAGRGEWIEPSPAKNNKISLAANKKIRLLFDQGTLTNAYPILLLNGGKNAVITLSYAEALFDSKRNKGNRDSIQGKTLIGFSDRYIGDGGMERSFSPLHFRTFRYVQVDIETTDDPITSLQLNSRFTGYPFKESAQFKTSNTSLQKIWTIGWRTARLCAVDTYFDCPYYEQLQYVGDTRIQALISLYVSGDERLMKKAISDISHSFFSDGLTQSRYPSRDLQVIPTFSLWWVCMLHDFWMNRSDDAFLRSQLQVMDNVLDWYKRKMASNGMLGSLQWWQFVDWSWNGKDSIEIGGVPPGASKGGSSIISLQYAYTLERASALCNYFGEKEKAQRYKSMADAIKRSTYELCWDKEKGLLADEPGKKTFSQHANIMAVLTDVIPADQQSELLMKAANDRSITQATYYFKFYLFEALKKVKNGNEYLRLLQPWYEMLDRGLTTFAEKGDPTRSDCHAWSASPNYEFLTLLCGINSAAPGFKRVRIEPWPNQLDFYGGRVPHPDGFINMELQKKDSGKTEIKISLPNTLTGVLVWKGKEWPLRGGQQTLLVN